MAFFKSFQSQLPSVNISSMLESVTTGVGELASAVSDATTAVSDQVSEQVTTIISKAEEGEAEGNQEESVETTESSASQQEWEWRDGGWRVKRTEAELEEEERKKQEEREWEEKREEKRREKRERQLEREAQEAERRKEMGQDDPKEAAENKEDKALEKGHDGGGEEDTQVEEEPTEERQGDECDEDAPPPPAPVARTGASGKDKEKEGASPEKEGKVSPPSPTKEKIPEKKKAAKDSAKKSKKDKEKKKPKTDTEKKKKKKSKKGKKKKSSKEGGSSESEEEKVPAENSGSVWNNRQKHTTEQEGYSSDASIQANNIQRIKRDHSLNELQPPPYQDEDTLARVSRSRSGRAVRRGSSPERSKGSSEASVDQDTESYLNKGYEEDVPSDSTAVLGAEDGSGPMLPSAYEPEPMAKYGTLDVAFEYDSGEQWLAVTVTAATDIPALKQTGNIAWQVHLVLLPTKKQRAKTGVQKGPCPVFTETFRFSRVEQEALGDYAVRFRLYSVRRMKKEKVLGEKIFYLTKLNLQGKMALPVTLEPGSELTGCGSLVSVSRSAGALSYRSSGDSLPEILLGLIYNAATGRLSAEVIQGSHFRTTASDKPTNGLFCCIKHFVGGQLYIMRDTYVKLTMLDSKGKEMSKCKTVVCRGQPNPTYKETFVFQVALFQLSEVSLVVSVFCCRSSMKPRERLGWVSLGHSSSGEDQQAHWAEMKEAEGQQQVCHWHTLSDT